MVEKTGPSDQAGMVQGGPPAQRQQSGRVSQASWLGFEAQAEGGGRRVGRQAVAFNFVLSQTRALVPEQPLLQGAQKWREGRTPPPPKWAVPPFLPPFCHRESRLSGSRGLCIFKVSVLEKQYSMNSKIETSENNEKSCQITNVKQLTNTTMQNPKQ